MNLFAYYKMGKRKHILKAWCFEMWYAQNVSESPHLFFFFFQKTPHLFFLIIIGSLLRVKNHSPSLICYMAQRFTWVMALDASTLSLPFHEIGICWPNVWWDKSSFKFMATLGWWDITNYLYEFQIIVMIVVFCY